jgi:polar amino acid transport system substrate-binding protein
MRTAVVLAAFVALSLACGGGKEPAPSTTTAPPPPPPEPPKPAPVAPASFATIKARGVMKVAADPEAPPFLSKNADGGWQGFEYGIMLALSDRAGASVQIVPGQFEDLPGLVTSGAADMAIGQMSPSAAYEGLAFSTSYLQYSLCLVVQKGSKARALGDLAGKRIGMYDDPVARQLTDVLVGASYDRQLFSDYGYFDKLAAGGLDAMVYDCPLARYELERWKDKLEIANDRLNVATYNVAMRAADAQLLVDVNSVLEEIGNNGLLASLQQKWLGKVMPAGDFETASGKVVIVKKGDTLSLISKRELGSPDRWREIYDVNKDVVGTNPQIIYIGMQLRIPKQAPK